MIKKNVSIIRADMARIEVNSSLIKAALLKGYRIGIFFNHEETQVEYHFKQDPRDLPGQLNSVVCVMYTSTASDPLRISGVTQSLKDFMKMVERPITYVNYNIPYKLVEVKLFPGDWYPCFENDKEARIDRVAKEIPSLMDVAKKIAEEDKKIAEEDHKRAEEDRIRRMEEARKARESSMARIAALAARPRPSSRITLPPSAIAGLTDDDISEMLAKGFFL